MQRFIFCMLMIVLFIYNSPRHTIGFEYFFKQGVTIRGSIDMNDQGDDEDTSFGHLVFTPQIEIEHDEIIEAKASLKADYIYANNFQNDMDQKEIRIWDSYVTFKRENFWLSVGNLLVRWGKADEFSPLDNVNPQDLRELIFADLEERKRPVPMAHLRIFRGEETFEFVFSPRLNHHKRNYFDTDWAVFKHYLDEFKGLQRIRRQKSTYSLRDSEMGFRWSFQLEGVDIGASIFYGHDRSPYPALRFPNDHALNFESLTSPEVMGRLTGFITLLPPAPVLRVEYPRDTVIGFEFETVMGSYGLRGEFAYHSGRVFLRDDGSYCQKEYYQYVIGVDRFFDNDLYLNLQFYQQVIGSYGDFILFDPEVDSGFTAKVLWPFADEKWEFSFNGFYSLASEMWYVNPEIRWKPIDNIYLFLGVHSIYGDEGSYFDLYDGNSDFYLGLKLIL